MLLVVILALLFYLFADFGAAGYDHNDPSVMFFVICMVLVAVFLVILFISHLIIFTVHKKRKKRQNTIMNGIPGGEGFAKIEPIKKGQSPDAKYYIEAAGGCKLLLRMTDIKEFERKQGEYNMLKRAHKLGVLVPEPVAFGLCGEGKHVYSLVGWIEGEDAETAMARMDEEEQYHFGHKAGQLFRGMHVLPAPEGVEPWAARFRRKVQTRIDLYVKHELFSEKGNRIVKYLRKNQDFLDGRPQTHWHGDMNVGNHIITPEGEIGAIDFNHWNLDHGDPWWEFVIAPWGKEPPAHYFTGMIDGYFDDRPPCAFFEALAYYYACDALSALCYTFLGSGPHTPEEGRRHLRNVLRWFDDMNNVVPSWYLKK